MQKAARKLSTESTPPLIRRVHLHKLPEDDVVQSLIEAIHGLEQSKSDYTRPPLADIGAEWVLSNKQTDDGPVIFYVHGGGYISGSVGTARRTTRKLANQSKGRCFAVQYRYATEQPFPGPLLDILVAYLSLLSPPSEMKHIAIPSKRIVFAGESVGFSLLLALTQVLLYLRARNRAIKFHGNSVTPELPSGITGLSGQFDITWSTPSWTRCAQSDIIPEAQASHTHIWKDQDLWPSTPPRADIYCERSAMLHPLVSPVTATNWKGCPPLFIACGEERCTDSNLYVARLAASQGVRVYLKQYERMCHVWPTVLPKLPHSEHAINTWAGQCRAMSEGEPADTKMEYTSFDTLEVEARDIGECISLDRQDLLKMMVKAQQARPLLRRTDRDARI